MSQLYIFLTSVSTTHRLRKYQPVVWNHGKINKAESIMYLKHISEVAYLPTWASLSQYQGFTVNKIIMFWDKHLGTNKQNNRTDNIQTIYVSQVTSISRIYNRFELGVFVIMSTQQWKCFQGENQDAPGPPAVFIFLLWRSEDHESHWDLVLRF